MALSHTDSVFLKRLFIFFVVVAVVGLLVFTTRSSISAGSVKLMEIANHATEKGHISTEAQRFIQQRNEVSRQLNEMKKLYGQKSCEHLQELKAAGKKVDTQVSENGGWCKEKSGPKSTSHMFDTGFAKAVSSFLKSKTIGSFGDGPGEYKKHLDEWGEVKSYTAYDGAPFCEQTTEGRVKFLDLTAPQYRLPAFDWVISVEVGEHIPAQFEDIYLDNLVRHAKEGLILSWAVPGQGGLSHVNNKPLEAVKEQLGKRGFSIDLEAGKPLRDAARLSWLKRNIHVYRRNSPLSFLEEDA